MVSCLWKPLPQKAFCQPSKRFFRKIETGTDVDQGEKTYEAQAQPMITSSTMPQRITRSKTQTLGDKHQLMSFFVISLE